MKALGVVMVALLSLPAGAEPLEVRLRATVGRATGLDASGFEVFPADGEIGLPEALRPAFAFHVVIEGGPVRGPGHLKRRFMVLHEMAGDRVSFRDAAAFERLVVASGVSTDETKVPPRALLAAWFAVTQGEMGQIDETPNGAAPPEVNALVRPVMATRQRDGALLVEGWTSPGGMRGANISRRRLFITPAGKVSAEATPAAELLERLHVFAIEREHRKDSSAHSVDITLAGDELVVRRAREVRDRDDYPPEPDRKRLDKAGLAKVQRLVETSGLLGARDVNQPLVGPGIDYTFELRTPAKTVKLHGPISGAAAFGKSAAYKAARELVAGLEQLAR